MPVVTLEDVEKEALLQGVEQKELKVPSYIILTFNKGIINSLTSCCRLKKWDWPVTQYSPYYSPCDGWRGFFSIREIAVFVPPMGTSAVSVFCEDLLYFGAHSIILLCASWSLGEAYLHKAQLHLPDVAVGFDGTTIHYGNRRGKIEAEKIVFGALEDSLEELKADYKIGGVGTVEAFYRLAPNMLRRYRRRYCLSIDNGEAAVIYALANYYNRPCGVLFQLYIDLDKG